MARPLANVTTAKLAPLVRNEGRAATNPNNTPHTSASGMAMSMGSPALVPNEPMANAPIPASAICMSEI